VVQGNARLSIAHAFRNPALGGWRLSVRVVRANPRQAVELRGVLMRGGKALTETWSYVLPRE
jgi:glucans biosynthesis protein